MAKSNNNGIFGWLGRHLGRQVGSVTGAVKADVQPPPKVLYQKTSVQEVTLPDRPDEKLRRTVIDEVIQAPKKLQ